MTISCNFGVNQLTTGSCSSLKFHRMTSTNTETTQTITDRFFYSPSNPLQVEFPICHKTEHNNNKRKQKDKMVLAQTDFEQEDIGMPLDNMYSYDSQKSPFQAKSQPIKCRITRTNSELQLYEDEQAAEYRDYCMYVRIVNGMTSRTEDMHSFDSSLQNVIKTRHSYSTMSESSVSSDLDSFNQDSSTPLLNECSNHNDKNILVSSRSPVLVFEDDCNEKECYSETEEIFDIDL